MKGKSQTLFAGLAALAALSLSSCGSSYHAGSSGNTDDVYYTPRADNGSTPSGSSSGNDNSAQGNSAQENSGNTDYYDQRRYQGIQNGYFIADQLYGSKTPDNTKHDYSQWK